VLRPKYFRTSLLWRDFFDVHATGEPEGRDQEFYLQALQELQTVAKDMKPDQPE
jgi:hypothetical protein